MVLSPRVTAFLFCSLMIGAEVLFLPVLQAQPFSPINPSHRDFEAVFRRLSGAESTQPADGMSPGALVSGLGGTTMLAVKRKRWARDWGVNPNSDEGRIDFLSPTTRGFDSHWLPHIIGSAGSGLGTLLESDAAGGFYVTTRNQIWHCSSSQIAAILTYYSYSSTQPPPPSLRIGDPTYGCRAGPSFSSGYAPHIRSMTVLGSQQVVLNVVSGVPHTPLGSSDIRYLDFSTNPVTEVIAVHAPTFSSSTSTNKTDFGVGMLKLGDLDGPGGYQHFIAVSHPTAPSAACPLDPSHNPQPCFGRVYTYAMDQSGVMSPFGAIFETSIPSQAFVSPNNSIGLGLEMGYVQTAANEKLLLIGAPLYESSINTPSSGALSVLRWEGPSSATPNSWAERDTLLPFDTKAHALAGYAVDVATVDSSPVNPGSSTIALIGAPGASEGGVMLASVIEGSHLSSFSSVPLRLYEIGFKERNTLVSAYSLGASIRSFPFSSLHYVYVGGDYGPANTSAVDFYQLNDIDLVAHLGATGRATAILDGCGLGELSGGTVLNAAHFQVGAGGTQPATVTVVTNNPLIPPSSSVVVKIGTMGSRTFDSSTNCGNVVDTFRTLSGVTNQPIALPFSIGADRYGQEMLIRAVINGSIQTATFRVVIK